MKPTGPLKFYEFIYDRQLLADRKRRNRTPWTKDPILAQYKFCNVRRKEDACTRHLLKFVIGNKCLKPVDVLFNIILYRRFNTRTFFRDVIFPEPMKKFWFRKAVQRMDAVRNKGIKLFNDAYVSIIAGGPYDESYRPGDKHVQILFSMKDIAESGILEEIVNMSRAKQIFDRLHFGGRHCIGNFMAYQILVDWNYYKSIEGMDSFVDIGPGAIGGVEFIFGTTLDAENNCLGLYESQKKQFRELRKLGKYWKWGHVALSDIENCLCEFRKYWKLKNGITTRVRRYRS